MRLKQNKANLHKLRSKFFKLNVEGVFSLENYVNKKLCFASDINQI